MSHVHLEGEERMVESSFAELKLLHIQRGIRKLLGWGVACDVIHTYYSFSICNPSDTKC